MDKEKESGKDKKHKYKENIIAITDDSQKRKDVENRKDNQSGDGKDINGEHEEKDKKSHDQQKKD